MTPKQEAQALGFDPWAGDMDDDSVTLRDAFVKARKPAKCAICFDDIPIGARVRSQTQQSDEQRKVMTFKFCETCCAFMATDDQRLESRYALGMSRAASPVPPPEEP